MGDKNKQKSIGLVIRSLKQEMKELGGHHYNGFVCSVGLHKESLSQLQLLFAKLIELGEQVLFLPSKNASLWVFMGLLLFDKEVCFVCCSQDQQA